MSTATTAFSYYPGCMAEETAREYDASIRLLARLLDIPLETIDDWNCCGAGIIQQTDAAAGAALAKRNLERSGDGRTLVSGCPVCVAMLQQAAGGEGILHVLGLLNRSDVRERIAERIRATGENRPLSSMKVACFYGDGLADPRLWGGTADDSPWPLDALMELAGAEVVKWGGSRRSAGGYVLYAKPEVGFAMLEKVFRDFEKSGADAIVTADPHAHLNLDSFQYEIGRRRRRALEVPILHFTEVLALAMNLERVDAWLHAHMAGVFGLIDRLVAEEEKRKEAEAKARKRRPEKETQPGGSGSEGNG